MSTKKPVAAEKWHEQAETLKRKADALPYGKEREELLRLVRQLETAADIDEWIRSPGLARPT